MPRATQPHLHRRPPCGPGGTPPWPGKPGWPPRTGWSRETVPLTIRLRRFRLLDLRLRLQPGHAGLRRYRRR